MLKVALKNQNGEVVNEEFELNENVFGIEPNNQAIFDMVLLQRASLRQGTHKVKGRSEVSGGGKKPWRQKGTGRARQGTIRAPQWRGGGVVFGPTPRKYGFKLNKKVRRLALRSALSQKVIDDELIALDNIAFDTIKTKNMVKVLDTFENPKKVLVVLDELNDEVVYSARNIPGVKVLDAKHINVYDILDCNKLMMTEKAIAAVEEVLA
ncbi:MAG: 50S ribosomal protein L4 [Erysipelotrichaceae bacterium]|nr:50S ribosomal protein L4 [Erysipelotrichaceae bacterium]